MNPIGEKFYKSERLCSRKIIESLFSKGRVIYNSVFKVVWDHCPVDIPHPAQAAFMVSKKGFKHAVTRNLIKRRMREAYRKNKQILYESLEKKNISIVILFIYRKDNIEDFASFESATKDIFVKIINSIAKK